MQTTLRSITKEDINTIYLINSAVQEFPWTKSAIQGEFGNPLSLGWVAFTDGSKASKKSFDAKVEITGYIFMRKNLGEAEIMSIGVAMEFQRKGVGQKLLSHAISQLSKGAVVHLEVSHLNEGALNLYKKEGFIISTTRKAYYPDGSDAVCMKLNIANP